MTDEQLRQLLEASDAPAPSSARPGDLARRVRERARRRGVAVRSAGVASVVLLASAALWLARHPASRERVAHDGQTAPHHPETTTTTTTTPRPIVPVVDLVALRREDAELEAEARLHQLTAEAMLRREASGSRVARAGRVVQSPDPIDRIAADRDLAARIMLRYGDRLLREPDPKAAAASYERVLELFPTSPEASAARLRLAQIKT